MCFKKVSRFVNDYETIYAAVEDNLIEDDLLLDGDSDSSEEEEEGDGMFPFLL